MAERINITKPIRFNACRDCSIAKRHIADLSKGIGVSGVMVSCSQQPLMFMGIIQIAERMMMVSHAFRDGYVYPVGEMKENVTSTCPGLN